MYYWIRDIRPDFADNVKDTIAPWQHVTLYGLSIGTEGNIVYPAGVDAITAGTQDWPQPTGSGSPDSVDDLWHAALNSRGKYFNAANPQQLAESIVSALADFTSQSGTGAAVGIAGAQLSATKKYGYRTSYESGWWGDVAQVRARHQDRRAARSRRTAIRRTIRCGRRPPRSTLRCWAPGGTRTAGS